MWGVIALTFLFVLPGARHPRAAGRRVADHDGRWSRRAVFLPQAPGFVGTWQAGCVLALRDFFGVPQELAVGYSLLTWIVPDGVNVGLAGLFLAREDLSLAQLDAGGGETAPAASRGAS